MIELCRQYNNRVGSSLACAWDSKQFQAWHLLYFVYQNIKKIFRKDNRPKLEGKQKISLQETKQTIKWVLHVLLSVVREI